MFAGLGIKQKTGLESPVRSERFALLKEWEQCSTLKLRTQYKSVQKENSEGLCGRGWASQKLNVGYSEELERSLSLGDWGEHSSSSETTKAHSWVSAMGWGERSRFQK